MVRERCFLTFAAKINDVEVISFVQESVGLGCSSEKEKKKPKTKPPRLVSDLGKSDGST